MQHHWISALSILSAVLLADLSTSPAPIWGDIRVMHTWNTVPANWESLGPPPAGTTIDLYIALEPHQEEALTDALYQVSDPKHQKYGKHLTKEQVAELVAPHQDTLEIVHSWLEHHGVPSPSISTSHGGGWLAISGVPVPQADELLCASYQLYRRIGTEDSGVILRTVSYALPAALHAHVQTVAPTTHFGSPRTPLQTQGKRSSEKAGVIMNATSGDLMKRLSRRYGIVTPSFLRWLYKTEAYVPSAMNRNALGAMGSLDDYPAQADLTQFMNTFRANAEAATFTVVPVNGGRGDPTQPGVGGNVLNQYAEAMAYPTPYIFYSTGGKLQWTSFEPSAGDAYLEWLNYLLSQPNRHIPPTIATLYADTEQDFPQHYAKAVCRLFARLGARGVSVLVASGDYGVGRGDCIDNYGNHQFLPTFPASCPWVTSVGGTAGFYPEDGASLSGGGFSLYFQRRSYQSVAVPTFLNTLGAKYTGLYYPSGRGIPDIAGQAQRFLYIRDATPYVMSSTICSTSTAAGIISLLNDYMLSTDRAPLGFLNPWLYSHGLASLNDITSGTNPGCNTDGFRATVGWDPVTGLGTLDFEILQQILEQDLDDDDAR